MFSTRIIGRPKSAICDVSIERACEVAGVGNLDDQLGAAAAQQSRG